MFGLTYHRAYRSNLIPFAVAVSGRFNSGHKTKLTALRLTNTGEQTAAVSFDNSYNGGVTRLQYRRDDVSVFEDWNLTAALAIAPGEYIEIAGDNSETQGALGRFSMTGDAVAASGNVMSLIYGVETGKDPLVIPEGITFDRMFANCNILTAAPELPATTLTKGCYYGMFVSCTRLTSVHTLPATILAEDCYCNMFTSCSSLNTVINLPATTLATNCYGYMFQHCTSLTAAPNLPATTLAERCYQYMFNDCTSLSNVPLILPATTLVKKCYGHMFYGCTSLTAAPELPATTLAEECYYGMFIDCTSLSTIIVGFTDWLVDSYATELWTDNVAGIGTFTCPSGLDTTLFGSRYIPEGWTVVTI